VKTDNKEKLKKVTQEFNDSLTNLKTTKSLKITEQENKLKYVESNLKTCKEEKDNLPNKQRSCEKPPIINLRETEGHSFDSGNAILEEGFKQKLKNEITKKLLEIKKEFNNVNVIEVIGHTDGVPTGVRNSNLDEELENAVKNNDISRLSYGSNTDLGLIRALSVAFFLKEQPELKGINFRIYSAAQLILTDGTLANNSLDRKPDENRRRIELRFTRLED